MVDESREREREIENGKKKYSHVSFYLNKTKNNNNNVRIRTQLFFCLCYVSDNESHRKCVLSVFGRYLRHFAQLRVDGRPFEASSVRNGF